MVRRQTFQKLCFTKIFIFVVLTSLIFVVSTQTHVVSTQIYVVSTQQIYYVASRNVNGPTFSITPCSEKLSSLAVACGPTTLQVLKLRDIETHNGVVAGNGLIIFFTAEKYSGTVA